MGVHSSQRLFPGCAALWKTEQFASGSPGSSCLWTLFDTLASSRRFLSEAIGKIITAVRQEASTLGAWFARQVRFILREAGGALQCTEARPFSSTLLGRMTVVWAPFPKGRLDDVDTWLLQCLGAPCFKSRAWRQLQPPPVRRDTA